MLHAIAAIQPSKCSTRRCAFTLVELLVVISIIVLIMALALPALSSARASSRTMQGKNNLRQIMLGTLQFVEKNNVLPAHKTPAYPANRAIARVQFNNYTSVVEVNQPRWPTLLSDYVESTFDPVEYAALADAFNKIDDRIAVVTNPIFVCPNAPERTTVRNIGYGYNYQFLGNSRPKHIGTDGLPTGDSRAVLPDGSFAAAGTYPAGAVVKPGAEYARFPLGIATLPASHMTVVYADSLGSASETAAALRTPYSGHEEIITSTGNHGYTLDPPRSFTPDGVDFTNAHYGPSECKLTSGVMPVNRMCAVDPRQQGKVNVVFLDGHTATMSPEDLGYSVNLDGSFNRNGVSNKFFSGKAADINPPPCDPQR